MVNCNYCNKEIDRLVFCCPSHKVMYHRTGKARNNTTMKSKDILSFEDLFQGDWVAICPNHNEKIQDCWRKHPDFQKQYLGSLKKI